MNPKQYEIVLVNLNPTLGSEISKTRPCVILSPDEQNDTIRTLIVAPMTSTSKPCPSRVALQEDSHIALEQLRTIDKQCIIKKLGELSQPQIAQVKAILKEMLVD